MYKGGPLPLWCNFQVALSCSCKLETCATPRVGAKETACV